MGRGTTLKAIEIPLSGGLKQGTSDLSGVGFITMQNVSRFKKDAIRRRPGLSTRINQGGIVMSSLLVNDENQIFHLTETGSIVRHGLGYEASVTSEITGLASSTYGVFAHADGSIFFCNGSDAVKYVDEDGNSGDAGVAGPASAPGSPTVSTASQIIDPGDHLFRYRYYSEDLKYFSDPSAYLKLTVNSTTSNLQFSVGSAGSGSDIIRTTDDRYDYIFVEATKAGGSNWFWAGDFLASVTAYNYALTDQALGAVHSEYISRGLPIADDTGNSPPPVLEWMCQHKGRLFGLRNNYLYWSKYGKPEQWSSFEMARSVRQSSDDQLSGITGYFDDVLIFGRYSVFLFKYVFSPDRESTLTQLPTTIGLWHQRLIVKAKSNMFGWGPDGIWIMKNMLPSIISDDVRETLESEIDYSQVEKFHVAYEPEDHVLYWFYVPSGETEVNAALVFDIENNEWRTASFDQGIDSSYLLVVGDGQAKMYVTTENDHTWHLEDGVVDGVLSGSTSVVTCTNSGSVTTINVNESLQTTQTLKGVYLYRVNTGELRRITGNAGGSITIASAFSTAIVAGEEFWVGSIDLDISPKWITSDDIFDRLQPSRVAISQVPESGSGTWRLYRYEDFVSAAKTWDVDLADEFPDGVTITDGNDYCELDMDKQNIHFGQSGQHVTSLRLRLRTRYPDSTPYLTRWMMHVVTKDSSSE